MVLGMDDLVAEADEGELTDCPEQNNLASHGCSKKVRLAYHRFVLRHSVFDPRARGPFPSPPRSP